METIHQCPSCNSQGEIEMEPRKEKVKFTERLILESKLVKELNGVIKKLNDEVDSLQTKLKEKENQDEKRYRFSRNSV